MGSTKLNESYIFGIISDVSTDIEIPFSSVYYWAESLLTSSSLPRTVWCVKSEAMKSMARMTNKIPHKGNQIYLLLLP